MFEWVFSKFLEKRSPYVFRKLGISEKTVYSWCYPQHLPHARINPIDKAKEVLSIIAELEPNLLFLALQELVSLYGFRLEPVKNGKPPTLAQLHKELSDVVQRELEASQDGRITPEEAKEILRELEEAEIVIAREKARLKELLEKVRR